MTEVLTNIYDKCETYTNCTVQILTNTATGERSIGWWDNENPPSVTGEKKMTRIEKLRSMSDREIAELILKGDMENISIADKACRLLDECDDLVDADEGIPAENCIDCILQWLHGEAV